MRKFVKGMVKDPERVDQPEGTFRDALNANLYYQKGAIVNEQGNKLIADVTPTITNIIGQCPLEDGRVVLFAIDEQSHIISLVSPKNGLYTVLYRNNDLNFQPDHTIEATAKVDTQGNVLVYFTDNYIVRKTEVNTGIDYIDDYNPPRVFNVTKQLNNLSAGESVLYGYPEYNVDKLDLFLNAGLIPQFDEVHIEDGGGVVSGTYHLALAYSDEDGNKTNYLVTSNAVHLVTSPEDAIPTESITGDPQGSQSKKSIRWEVTIPATVNYSHITPVVIQRLGGGYNQEASEFAYALTDVKIPEYTGQQRTLEFTYTGLESVASEAIEAVIIDNVRYEAAKTLVQLNNQLYLSNLQSRGDIGYQRFANNIQLEAVTEKIEKFDPRFFDVITLNQGYPQITKSFTNAEYSIESRLSNFRGVQATDQYDEDELSPGQETKFDSPNRKGYKDTKMFYKKKSYRRSEVYAFYISFVLKDGTESYAYHIPGREALKIRDLITGDIYENSSIKEIQDNNALPPSILGLSELNNGYADAKLYQAIDTQVLLSEIGDFNLSDVNPVEKSTSFWENETEFYPQTEDFSVWSTNTTGLPIPAGNIKGQNVRHHKMPSNKHNDWRFIGEENNEVSNFSPTIWDADTKLKMKEDIKILGIQLSNIRIPKFILRQVQGYKVYYAKRTQANKTVLGQSVVVPASLRANTVITMDRELAARSKYNRAWWMYGGIPPNKGSYPKVYRHGYNYNGISVFGFHDFNLLKNKHTLSAASHIDVQSVLIMRHFRGGPNIKEDTITNEKSFYLPEWVNSNVANITDPDSGDSGVPTSLKVRAFITSVMLATGYFRPSTVNEESEFVISSGTGVLSNLNSVFALKPKSITYLPPHLHLETTVGTEYNGVRYLLNFAGESEIAIGLESGLPMAVSWASNGNGQVTGTRFPWYIPGGYLNPTNDSEYNNLYSLLPGTPWAAEYPEGDTKVTLGGWPLVYLVNLSSIKTDVYKSFDEQQLVWTGYYKDLSEVSESSGEDVRDNYYKGAASDPIFGGDTYIGRYSFRSTSLSYGHSTFNWFDIPLDQEEGTSGGTYTVPPESDWDWTLWTAGVFDTTEEVIDEGSHDEDTLTPWSVPETWRKGNNTPISTIFHFFCESDDLLGYRHQGDQNSGTSVKDSSFFDASTANSVLFDGPLFDKTHMDHLLYMNNYSFNQDIRVAVPYPKKLNDVTAFPTRTIRSLDDEGSINDKYRIYQALEFKDLPRNRGDIFKLFTLGAILYLLTERSLFVTRGKQQLQLGDNTQAYVGSGNIFEQDPDEVLPTTQGYGGCDAQFTALTTRYGQFYVNRRDKKVYMYSEGITEISSLGMEKWFLDRIPFQLESLGIDLAQSNIELDAPTDMFGFVATYDPKFKRIILSKKERVATTSLLVGLNSNQIIVQDNSFYNKRLDRPISFDDNQYFADGGWTISYYPELGAWGSRHSYLPKLYAATAEEYYSLTNNDGNVWEHSDVNNPGNYFGEPNSFEFEFIDNTAPGMPKVFSTIYYWSEVVNLSSVNYLETEKQLSTGFDSFYVYNTTQISGEPTTINYLSNARRSDRVWNINSFRDMSKQTELTNSELVTGIVNVAGDFTEQVTEAQNNVTMFSTEGVVNPSYINPNKSWFEQKRFVDHYLGVRLISDNSTNNLVYLYAAGTKHRQSFR
jgi:hypothetical protein